MKKILFIILLSIFAFNIAFADQFPKADETVSENNFEAYLKDHSHYTGSIKVLFNDGSAKIFNFKRGILNGKYQNFYENGSLEDFGNYINGKLEGDFESYYENGMLFELSHYFHDKVDGTYKKYFNTGVLAETGIYKKDKLDGEYKIFFEDGSLHQIIYYKNNHKEGISKIFNKDGSLFSTIEYKYGKIIAGKCGNGREWIAIEIKNMNNGAEVICK